MHPPQRKNRPFNPVLILFLPVILVFDVVYYLYTRSTCFQCGNVDEFVRTSSLTFFTISQAWQILRRK